MQISYIYDDYSVDIGPISKEDAEITYSLIERVQESISDDKIIQDIFAIIEEEVEAYYAGDKKAEEVADIIQNRANIYISENE